MAHRSGVVHTCRECCCVDSVVAELDSKEEVGVFEDYLKNCNQNNED